MCRGAMSRGLVLALLLVAGCSLTVRGQELCSSLLEPVADSFTEVANDAELLAAVVNQTVQGILLTQDVVLGTSWTYLKSRINIARSVLIRGKDKRTVLDLAHFTDILVLEANVTVAFNTMTMLNTRKRNPLQPGLDIIASTTDNNAVILTNVLLMPTCCLPAGRWGDYVNGLGADPTHAVHVETLFTCSNAESGSQTCYKQLVTFTDLCVEITLPSEARVSAWASVTMLCAGVTDDACVLRDGATACLEQCQRASDPAAANSTAAVVVPALDQQPAASPAEDGHTHTDTVIIIVLSSVLGCAALCVATWGGYRMYARRRAKRADADSSSKGTMDMEQSIPTRASVAVDVAGRRSPACGNGHGNGSGSLTVAVVSNPNVQSSGSGEGHRWCVSLLPPQLPLSQSQLSAVMLPSVLPEAPMSVPAAQSALAAAAARDVRILAFVGPPNSASLASLGPYQPQGQGEQGQGQQLPGTSSAPQSLQQQGQQEQQLQLSHLQKNSAPVSTAGGAAAAASSSSRAGSDGSGGRTRTAQAGSSWAPSDAPNGSSSFQQQQQQANVRSKLAPNGTVSGNHLSPQGGSRGAVAGVSSAFGPGGGGAAAAIAAAAAVSATHVGDFADAEYPRMHGGDIVQRVQQVAEDREISPDEKLIIGKPIGCGAFGMVYRGLWKNLDVAVKTLLFSQNDSVRQENALVEAALASSVNHPNVVSLFHYDMKPVTSQTHQGGAGTHIMDTNSSEIPTDWKMYLVMELCQTSLADTLDKFVFHDQAGAPRLDLVLAVLLDVAAGCTHIHSKNIIWGDLKPENVLLRMDASRPHGIIAKITDFGMSTTIDPGMSHISGFNKGTPCYAAPEVMLSHHATKTTDVFSFGILMQQMISRCPPYVRMPGGGIEINKQFWEPVPSAPATYTELRRQCLDQAPKNRPSFDQVMHSLQAMYNDHMSLIQPSQAQQQQAQQHAQQQAQQQLAQQQRQWQPRAPQAQQAQQ
ncbi:hypothetical protein FOA52_001028 [Chlamydomonas sp. UWO 241]|nr:hypothetical protein FOA52_001028 [Chlamydomonas sp. UWO 241]